VSEVALIVLPVVLVPIAVGVVTGLIMNPHGPWKHSLEVAAVGSGVVAALVLVAIVVGLLADPSECTHAGCNDSDNAAGAQVALVISLLVPIYVLVLPGAAVGKLLGRGVRRLAHRWGL
jgi:hypothetical protein